MPDITTSWVTAILGLAVAIVLILKKFNPVYSLFFDAIVDCLIGGTSLSDTVAVLLNGAQSIMGTAIRVLVAGMLAGVVMESGTAESIANTIIQKLGEKKAILPLALSTVAITAVGVLIPIAVLIVTPITLSTGKSTGISKLSLLIALSGGGKVSNTISPNPDTIATANGFDLLLSNVMIAGFIPAVLGLITAIVLASIMRNKGSMVKEADLVEE